MDALLLVMVLIWGANFSVIKTALRELPPQAFNAVRLVIASACFVVALALAARRRPRGASRPVPGRPGVFEVSAWPGARDGLMLAALGVLGHFVYQIGFIGGLARSSVANSSLIIGCSPVVVALLSALVGHERLGRRHWAGAWFSVAGIYLLVGRGAAVSAETVRGDVLTVLAVFCWAVYTVASRPLLARHSPLVVTGLSMAVGTGIYAATSLPAILSVSWTRVSVGTWVALVFSALLALNVAYLIWLTAVQRIGSARTAVYSNLVPVAALSFATLWLGESLDRSKAAGAAAVLTGIALTRLDAPGRRG